METDRWVWGTRQSTTASVAAIARMIRRGRSVPSLNVAVRRSVIENL